MLLQRLAWGVADGLSSFLPSRSCHTLSVKSNLKLSDWEVDHEGLLGFLLTFPGSGESSISTSSSICDLSSPAYFQVALYFGYLILKENSDLIGSFLRGPDNPQNESAIKSPGPDEKLLRIALGSTMEPILDFVGFGEIRVGIFIEIGCIWVEIAFEVGIVQRACW